MRTSNMNMEDPAEQEKIRRQPHEYIATEGKHGIYRPKPYVHQPYPKMMLSTPKPDWKEFKGKPGAQELFDLAVKEWDSAMSASIVNSEAEERRWRKKQAAA